MRPISSIAVVAVLFLALAQGTALSQSTLGPGRKVTVSLLAHPIPTHPQYSKLDMPFFRETLAKRSDNRLEVKTSTWTEMGITGYEIVRMARQGQIDIGNAPLT